jgi:phenylpropionate dioxygenase-like ring-hydroxylating dioxygenase large terminal subunit
MTESNFNFFQQWYPVAPLEDLPENKPSQIIILGISFLIWKSPHSQEYQVFEDICPHRYAPLSQGRIEPKTGNLMCSYHGWEFNIEGKCTRIPQSDNSEILEKNKADLCVKVFPSCQKQGLLWVWADADSVELAHKTHLPLSPQIPENSENSDVVWSSMRRELEYDWQTLVENVADPSHVPFAHHGVQGNRNMARPLPIKIIESTPLKIEAENDLGRGSKITFEPPCRLEYAINFGGDKKAGLITYCIPVTPGKSRIVAQFSRNFAQKLHKVIPRWWDHITNRHLVLDGDMILLHQQELLLQQKNKNWQTAYKMPTSADRLVIEFRRWFDHFAQGKLPWQEVGISVLPVTEITHNPEQILDRYHQHTQFCSSCNQALKVTKKLQLVLLINFIISISMVAVMPDQLRLSFGLVLMVIALVGLGIYSWLKFWLEPRFYFINYIHADQK